MRGDANRSGIIDSSFAWNSFTVVDLLGRIGLSAWKKLHGLQLKKSQACLKGSLSSLKNVFQVEKYFFL